MKLIKHIGKLKDLETKVIVVFMQNPEDKSKALVVATHTLPDLVQDEIMRHIESDECQSERDLATYLNRKTLATSNGASILQWLHSHNKLIVVPIEAVTMTPHPGYPTPLSDIVGLMKEQSDAVKTADKPTSLVTADTDEEKTAVANNLLIEAKMLREEADKKEATAQSLLGSVGGEVAKKKTRKKKASTEAAS